MGTIVQIDKSIANYELYIKKLDNIFRQYGTSVLGGCGFICLMGFRKTYTGISQIQPIWTWFKDDGYVLLASLAEGEHMLTEKYDDYILRTVIHGRQHDYYLYSIVESIESCMDLMDISKTMNT
jgi:hypothetical protein